VHDWQAHRRLEIRHELPAAGRVLRHEEEAQIDQRRFSATHLDRRDGVCVQRHRDNLSGRAVRGRFKDDETAVQRLDGHLFVCTAAGRAAPETDFVQQRFILRRFDHDADDVLPR
jgi:hypothetical protein